MDHNIMYCSVPQPLCSCKSNTVICLVATFSFFIQSFFFDLEFLEFSVSTLFEKGLMNVSNYA